MIAAGKLTRRAAFKRRFETSTVPGTIRGEFEFYMVGIPAMYEDGRPVEIAYGGLTTLGRAGTLTIRDNNAARLVTTEQRAIVDQIEFEITSIITPLRNTGELKMILVEAPGSRSLSAGLEQKGEQVTLRRIVPNQPSIEVTARAHIRGYTPDELVGGVNQGDREVILSADDLVAKGITSLKENSDSLIVRGRKMTIGSVDDSTYRFAGKLVAYKLRVTG